MSASSRLRLLCSQCDKSARNCSGPCACTVDGIDIRQHAAERYCPLGRYRLGLGDFVAIVTHRTGIQWVIRKLKRGKPCGGCKGRQMKLNQLSEAK